jgi:hypothetical protein
LKNLITGVQGLRVGHSQDERLGSGATVLIFEAPAIASIAVHGGAPGLRDAALLERGMTGGSVYDLDSMGGVAALLCERGAVVACFLRRRHDFFRGNRNREKTLLAR